MKILKRHHCKIPFFKEFGCGITDCYYHPKILTIYLPVKDDAILDRARRESNCYIYKNDNNVCYVHSYWLMKQISENNPLKKRLIFRLKRLQSEIEEINNEHIHKYFLKNFPKSCQPLR